VRVTVYVKRGGLWYSGAGPQYPGMAVWADDRSDARGLSLGEARDVVAAYGGEVVQSSPVPLPP